MNVTSVSFAQALTTGLSKLKAIRDGMRFAPKPAEPKDRPAFLAKLRRDKTRAPFLCKHI